MDRDSLVTIGDDIISSVKHYFPLDAEYDSIFDSERLGYVCRINWRLNTDSNRPNKPARIILIVISKESIDNADYFNRREIILPRFKVDILKRLRNFESEHNTPYEMSPPLVEWVIAGVL